MILRVKRPTCTFIIIVVVVVVDDDDDDDDHDDDNDDDDPKNRAQSFVFFFIANSLLCLSLSFFARTCWTVGLTTANASAV